MSRPRETAQEALARARELLLDYEAAITLKENDWQVEYAKRLQSVSYTLLNIARTTRT